MADDVTKRMKYFDRQFLRASDFQVEQAYHMDRHRRHAQLLHQPGVAEGLDVTGTVGSTMVTVSPGTAIDSDGRAIVVLAPQTKQVSVPAGTTRAEIYIAYGQGETDSRSEGGVTGSTRITESPTFPMRRIEPGPAETPPNGVLLAEVFLDANGRLTVALNNPNNAVRTHAGAVVRDDLTVRTLTLKRDGIAASQWPRLSCSQANEASLENSSLRLDTNREVIFQSQGQMRSSGNMLFITGAPNPTEKMRILANGNVGIGLANPGARLSISGADATVNVETAEVVRLLRPAVGGIKNHNSAGLFVGAFEPGIDGRTQLDIKLSGTPNNSNVFGSIPDVTVISLRASGTIGIGTTGPHFGRVTIEDIAVPLAFRDSNVAIDQGGLWRMPVDNGILRFDVNTGVAGSEFGNNFRVALAMTKEGNVGIGTVQAHRPLTIENAGDASISLQDLNVPRGNRWEIQTSAFTSDTFGILRYEGGVAQGSKSLVITNGGNIGIGRAPDPAFKLDVSGAAHASSFPTSSDARFKTEITPLTNVLEKLEKIHGISFAWNELYESLGRSTGRREIGVMAQEVEDVFPEVVTTWGDEGYKAVDYSRLTAVLLEAVKELKAETTALKQRIETLERATAKKRKRGNPKTLSS